MKSIFTKSLLISGLLLFACNDLLNEYNPSGLTAEAVYTKPEGFESLVYSAYATARHWYGKEDGYTLTEGGTDLWLQGVDNRRVDLMTYNNLQAPELIPPLSTSEVFLERLWERFYATINLCNTGILHIAESGLSAELQKTREAELKFLRA
ncbi:MAG TPA: RagB/SusD family nutrient uptake outer membrane protein, partial [Ohtaekwangia sp.]